MRSNRTGVTNLKYTIIISNISLISKFFLSFILINFSLTRCLQVPTDYSSIQAALNDCIENDTILVSSGTYYENLIWPNQNNITLLGESLENTIINGNNLSSVIFISYEDNNYFFFNTKIENFTLMNGNTTSDFPNDRGGGIFLMNSSPIINNVHIINSYASYGAGISLINNLTLMQ